MLARFGKTIEVKKNHLGFFWAIFLGACFLLGLLSLGPTFLGAYFPWSHFLGGDLQQFMLDLNRFLFCWFWLSFWFSFWAGFPLWQKRTQIKWLAGFSVSLYQIGSGFTSAIRGDTNGGCGHFYLCCCVVKYLFVCVCVWACEWVAQRGRRYMPWCYMFQAPAIGQKVYI